MLNKKDQIYFDKINSLVYKWAEECTDTVYNEVLIANKRHIYVARAFWALYEQLDLLTAKTVREREYKEAISTICKLMEEEMDFCISKIELMKHLTNNNVTSTEIVQQLFYNKQP